MLTEIQKLAIASLNPQVARELIPVGTHVIEPFTIEVSGSLEVLDNEVYTPTVDIPLIPTVALALKKMGIQREHFLSVMRGAVEEVLLTPKSMREALVAQAGLAEFEAEFRQAVLANLPNKTRKGKVLGAVSAVPVVTGLAT